VSLTRVQTERGQLLQVAAHLAVTVLAILKVTPSVSGSEAGEAQVRRKLRSWMKDRHFSPRVPHPLPFHPQVVVVVAQGFTAAAAADLTRFRRAFRVAVGLRG
jgi:hypothetical protein